MNKEDLLNILRICNADQTAIDAVEMGYEAGLAAGAISAATLVELELRAALAERDELKKDLIFVERWANHHGQKPCHTPAEILGVIQHYPSIKVITESYADGVLPTTPDPYAERDALKELLSQAAKEIDELRAALESLEENIDVIAIYDGTEGRRSWANAGAWLYPGDKIAVIFGEKS